ncbi:NAD(P)-dependent dehydrogenase (short-subunit alcohol dehydrogenase family) [Paraburkholderia sp. BL23I1N1]|uniref:SDR family NAD(P)-dependent oxidoreductase n=1 Tax=Paraburkholderia sp. BL23I1N1 TaxID=1938802 RepID=UPI000E736B67|nr:SDR family NAD(P)-dependent oxidoreductase [Paraburkholderia sp. BL23I1N1]RKE38666.1 NAD(P)-dependent dehydrogenase (short-subunit alcohol dehydrogenase family) [Paraburkholderia sp. BL23I1N1]
MDSNLKGKVAIVTGAGSIGPGWGNGRAVAVAMARAGALVLACDRSSEAVTETVDFIRTEGGTAELFVGDVSSNQDMLAMTELCVARFGGIDILHNNVGIHAVGGPVETSEEEWDRIMAVNVKSMFLTCKHVLPVLESRSGGSIINVGSVTAQRYMGIPTIAYTTSKGAIVSFTKAVAAQYGDRNIRANVIVPGIIDTPVMRSGDMAFAGSLGSGDRARAEENRRQGVPLRRFGQAWDVASAAVFLASDAAAYITGTELAVDGGLSCRAF